jgi:hypothetical protein
MVSSRLLVLTPLRIEQLAVRDGARTLRTGMGPRRAMIAAARAQAIEADGVAVAGVCGGVAPGIGPGDVVCASELRREDRSVIAVPGSALLAAALRLRGLRVHVGPVLSVGRLVRKGTWDEAREGGVLAVDMESAWLAPGAAGRPFAVLRTVADPAGQGLLDPRLVVTGAQALKSLRRARPAFAEWAAALAPRRVLLTRWGSLDRADPAIAIVEPALRQRGAPIAGSQTSSNANLLLEVSQAEGSRAYLVDDVTDVDVAWLAGASTVAVTAGASAPEQLVERLVSALAALGPIEVEECVATSESQRFPKELAAYPGARS